MESSIPSFAWRGPRGSGKRTQLLNFLKKRSEKLGIPFEIKYATWYLTKQTAGGDPDEDDDDEATGKTIPYEESHIHMGFDVARMSMSDKVFLQSILQRWTGQQDVCLTGTALTTRYLVLYHAQHLTDESVLQLQEALEQYPNFSILLTTEIPICGRIRDYCFEIPMPGRDKLLEKYSTTSGLPEKDVWKTFFANTLEDWSTCIECWTTSRNTELIVKIRNWIYICLQRNLRWSDVITYWIETIYETKWLGPEGRANVLKVLSEAESGNGWVLVTSYRIPILWEHVHLQLAKELIKYRHKGDGPTSSTSIATTSK
jgi:hypothetical protein